MLLPEFMLLLGNGVTRANHPGILLLVYWAEIGRVAVGLPRVPAIAVQFDLGL